MSLNKARIWLGGLAGGVVWVLWSFIVGKFLITDARYAAAQASGLFLKTPRYPFFAGQWIIMLLVLAIALAHLYAWSRQTLGPGPGSTLKGGFTSGFIAGFPPNFAPATSSPIDRAVPCGWMMDIGVGSILATLVAGAIYKG